MSLARSGARINCTGISFRKLMMLGDNTIV